jgi:cell wall-associated NlpC family hydrolase
MPPSLFLLYLLSLVSTPYRWGGANPLTGLDCSGFILWALRFTDMSPPSDMTAHVIHDWLLQTGGDTVTGEPQLGDIAFYGSKDKITHVAMCVDSYRILHAAGGDSRVKTLEDAKMRNACVRGDLLRYRKDLVCVVRPKYTRPL